MIPFYKILENSILAYNDKKNISSCLGRVGVGKEQKEGSQSSPRKLLRVMDMFIS